MSSLLAILLLPQSPSTDLLGECTAEWRVFGRNVQSSVCSCSGEEFPIILLFSVVLLCFQN